MKTKFIQAFMDCAVRFSQLSTAKRLQVGVIIVKDDRIISIGYNGMPAGWTNDCEHETENGIITKDEVIHAEANAIAKLAKSSESGQDALMFCTHAPCIHCAKMIYTSGITKVYYKQQYKTDDGLEFLKKCNVIVEHTG